MRSELTRLLEAAETTFSQAPPSLDAWARRHAGPRLPELEHLYGQKNGFLAFDHALRVFPAVPASHDLSLNRWNSPRLWRDAYGDLADGPLFFADDIFGGQFCVRQGHIFAFDPETAAFEFLAQDLEGWARVILSDIDFRTGRPFARDWQAMHGPLEPTQRLVPKRLFMLGGTFELENFYVLDAVQAMRFRGEVAYQTHDLPDGAQVRFVVTD